MNGETRPPLASLRYSPVALVADIVRLLRGRGLSVSGTFEHSGALLRASADLLDRLGVEPDRSLPPPPLEHGPIIAAAATLMRAAGIEPNAVTVWPGSMR